MPPCSQNWWCLLSCSPVGVCYKAELLTAVALAHMQLSILPPECTAEPVQLGSSDLISIFSLAQPQECSHVFSDNFKPLCAYLLEVGSTKVIVGKA